MKKIWLIIFFWLFTLFSGVFQCSQNTLPLPNPKLNPVTIMNTYASNKAIRIQFAGNNSVSGFYGYNVYVNTAQTIDENINFVPINASDISFVSTESSPNSLISITVLSDSFGMPLTNGKNYFVYMKSIALYSGEYFYSGVGATSSVMPETNYVFLLHNLFSGVTNNSFQITPSGSCFVTNISTNEKADFVVSLQENQGNFYPYLISKTNIHLQDLGYYESLWACNQVPNLGYADSPIFLINNHIIAFYDSDSQIYGKMFILSVPEVQTSKTADVIFEINVMLNKNGRAVF